jgi:tetratricopeptide (TPR) repeat protein
MEGRERAGLFLKAPGHPARRIQMEMNSQSPYGDGTTEDTNSGKSNPGKVMRRGLFLALLVFFTCLPLLQSEFIFCDDPDYVVANPQVQPGLTRAGIAWAFGSTVGGNWHPLTWLSHMLDCQLFGLKSWGHHLTNLLLHAVNTLLLFLVLQRMTGLRAGAAGVEAVADKSAPPAGAAGRSFFVAALFGLHPMHVESVAWVAERKDVLSTFFWMLTLLAYARYANKQGADPRNQLAGGMAGEIKIQIPSSNFHLPASLFYWLALLCFVCGLMSKPMLVTLPFVLLLLDYWPLQRLTTLDPRSSTFRQLVLEKAPFFLFSLAAGVVTFRAQTGFGAMRTMTSFPLTVRVENALVAYVRYLGKLFWPAKLPFFYPHPGHWPLATVLAAGLLLLGISIVAWMTRRNRPYLLVGWCWYVGTLVPVIGLVQVGYQSMANRYSYVPFIGMFLFFAWLAEALTRRWRYQLPILATLAAAIILACIPTTRRQIGYWKNSEVLLQYASVVIDNNWLAYARLGLVFSKEGRTDEAISQYRQALKLNPDDADTHYNLANALYRKGLLDEAISEYQENLRLNPGDAGGHNNLGIALFRAGRRQEAIAHFQEALRLKPDYDEVRRNLTAAQGAK